MVLFPAALALLVSLSACGGDNASSSEADPTPAPSAAVSSTSEATPTPTPAATPTAKPTAAPTAKAVSSAAESSQPAPSSEDEEPQEPEYSEPSANEPEPEPEPTPEPEPDPTPEPPQANPADYKGSDVSALYSVFGYPNGSDYGPSCLGSGEDGILYYDGFTVYTYRDDSGERILDVG